MCQCCLIHFYFFNIYICTKRDHGMYKYQQVNFFSNVIKSIRPTYGNTEELATLIHCLKNIPYKCRVFLKNLVLNNISVDINEFMKCRCILYVML